MSARRDFHFVFGLREQREPFHILHYLCLASCRAVNRPDTIHFHYRHEPFGPWWEKIKPHLRLVRAPDVVEGFAPARYADSAEGRFIDQLGLSYAHEADFLRLDILIVHGGVYCDMDTLFVRPYADAWFAEDFAIGEESAPFARGQVIRPTLCNAVMFARPASRFARVWRERMVAAFDGSWSGHSCHEAARLWRVMPDALRVLPREYFYRYGSTIAGLKSLLEQSDVEHSDLYSMHLWAHLWWEQSRQDFSAVHAGQIDENWILTRDCTLAKLARKFLD
ncbi:MAG TPA: glycosyltransferase [Rudaea sp.]|nr:glycosyltransferase [Rudaea sp.]